MKAIPKKNCMNLQPGTNPCSKAVNSKRADLPKTFVLLQINKEIQNSYPVDFLQTGGGQCCQCLVVKF